MRIHLELLNHSELPSPVPCYTLKWALGYIQTLLPYTILEGSTFKAITSFFAKQLSKVPQVKPIAPFGLCYESKYFTSTLLGPGVPSIDLELEGQDAVWSIFGLNSMVEAKPRMLCLAFVNGGIDYRANINIGLYQIQDIQMKFDLESQCWASVAHSAKFGLIAQTSTSLLLLNIPKTIMVDLPFGELN